MRHLFALFLITGCLSACSSYQYMTLSSPQLAKNDKHQLVYENDTMRLTYDFNGRNGPVSINIMNKSSQPLYINWKKSALIRNEQSISYFDRNVQFSGVGTSYGSSVGRFASSVSDIHGSFTLPEGMDFIPPGSSISKGLLIINTTGPTAVEIPDSAAEQKLNDSYNIKLASYRRQNYDPLNSPVRFKSYLTFTLGMNNTSEFAQSNDFYVSEALDTKTAPEEFPLYQQQGDKFFLKYKKQQ